MSWETIQKILKVLTDTIQNSTIASVHSVRETITSHLYKVEVQNPITKMTIGGKVSVTNHPDYKKELKNIEEAVKDIEVPKKIEVTNFPKVPVFPKFPAFPKEFKISNPQESVSITNLKEVTSSLNELKKQISKLKLDPKVQVDAPVIPPPVVRVEKTPSPTVNVEAPDLSFFEELTNYFESLNEKKPLPVRLSDGKSFYKALDRITEFVTSNGNATSFLDSDGNPDNGRIDKNKNLKVSTSERWEFNQSEEVDDNNSYIGEESVDADWRIRKIVKDGSITTITYATARNNPEVESYPEAWTNRANLEYGRVGEAF